MIDQSNKKKGGYLVLSESIRWQAAELITKFTLENQKKNVYHSFYMH